MKYSFLSFGMVSIITAIVFFLITLSVTFAQTATQLRPGTTDVNDARSERPVDAPKIAPVPVRFKEVREVKDVEVRNTQVESGERNDKPQTFLEKARNVLQKKRENKTELRNDGNKREAREELRDKKTNENSEERLAELKEKKQERVANFLNNVKRKMDAAISRLLQLSERIESRIVKLEERGVDMTESRRLIGDAKNDIEKAKENIATSVENAREALAADLSRDSFGNVVSELTKAKENLRNAHASLIQTIRAMKSSISDSQDTNETSEQETN
ncbi:hypothetical protein HQ403_02225 [Candidatus Kaiserbacteria bacterium]|nr:hypothetical protein [Candidatus Kaiserbacteria bacterium]